jgi:hypothetical protein
VNSRRLPPFDESEYDMNTISKLVALAVFATGAATISFSAPTQAQTASRVPPAISVPPVCCTLATKTVVTGQPGWTLQLPSMATPAPVVISPTNSFWSQISGTQWIGPGANAGLNSGYPGGLYVYSYHFCLCGAPKGIPFPATLSLHVLADDDFDVELNGNLIGSHSGGWGFATTPPAPQNAGVPAGGVAINVTSTNFRACDNVLTFKVHNMAGTNSPTGLDVSGSITGFFAQPMPRVPCPCQRASTTESH